MKFVKRFISHFRRRDTDSTDPTMENVVNSMFLCQPLYNELKAKCHPDRYIDIEQAKQAEMLFQSLQKHKYNYNEILELREQINTLWESRK